MRDVLTPYIPEIVIGSQTVVAQRTLDSAVGDCRATCAIESRRRQFALFHGVWTAKTIVSAQTHSACWARTLFWAVEARQCAFPARSLYVWVEIR